MEVKQTNSMQLTVHRLPLHVQQLLCHLAKVN